jgi:aspartate kinase
MIVMKFGGSSVATAERIRYVAEIVKARISEKPALVLSAMGDTTDHLLEAASAARKDGAFSLEPIVELHRNTLAELGLGDQAAADLDSLFGELRSLLTGIALIKELSDKTRDYLVSFGERLSVRLVAAYLDSAGVKARAMDAWDAGLLSDSNFSAAELDEDSWNRVPGALNPLMDEGVLPVITGFIAKDRHGNITTLGRGGSDLSATFIAAALGAEEVQVWKDVDGIMTADPRLVKTARPVKTVSYEEAAELAYFGAQVLHPRAMQPCIRTGATLRVKNSYNPQAEGTRIIAAVDNKAGPVRAITSRTNITLVDIVSTRMVGQHGFLAEVFAAFANHKISVDVVATSVVSISLTLDTAHNLEKLRKDLSRIADVEIKTGKAIVTIIGDVRRSSEILQRAFGTCVLLGIQIQMVSQGASKVNISFIVDGDQAAEVVVALHQCFFEPLKKEDAQ